MRTVRSAFRWTGLVLTVLLVALIPFSIFYAISWATSPTLRFGVVAGQLLGTWTPGAAAQPPASRSPTGIFINRNPPTYFFRLACDMNAPTRSLWVPLPLVCVMIGVPTAYAWRTHWRRRRVEAGGCAGCGYDLKGLTSALCPECGSAADQAPSPTV